MNIADELKKLKELVDEGILTEEEFNLQKDKLLNDGNEVKEDENNSSQFTFSETITNVRPPRFQGGNWREVNVVVEKNKLTVKSTPESNFDFQISITDILQFNYGPPNKKFSETKPESTKGKLEFFYKNRKSGSIDTAELLIYSEAEEDLLQPLMDNLNESLVDKPMSCPKCDSQDVQAARGKLGMVTLGVVFLPLAALAPKSKMKCKACGSRWQNPF